VLTQRLQESGFAVLLHFGIAFYRGNFLQISNVKPVRLAAGSPESYMKNN
jgi:hypothetical protein